MSKLLLRVRPRRRLSAMRLRMWVDLKWVVYAMLRLHLRGRPNNRVLPWLQMWMEVKRELCELPWLPIWVELRRELCAGLWLPMWVELKRELCAVP